MQKREVEAWLQRIDKIHRKKIDLGLDRVTQIAKRLDLLKPSCPVIIVAGTNGKGSTVAALEAAYLTAGYRVGSYFSPFLFRINENIKIQGIDIEDKFLLDAFERIEIARRDTTLTMFEFMTLATLYIFKKSNLDVYILEVGLGGLLDAVNIIDADVSIVTSISIEHAALLGNTREKIALHKAGVFRGKKPAICGDLQPPITLINYANEIGALLLCQGKQFGFEKNNSTWTWWSEKNRLENLPLPSLALHNMSIGLMAVELLQDKLPISRKDIDKALEKIKLPARIQIIPGTITHILDVSHNPAAVEFLATYLRENSCPGKTRAVFSMLEDKDIVTTLRIMKEYIDDWYMAPLLVERGMPISALKSGFQEAAISNVREYPSIPEAYHSAYSESKLHDRIIVFGSFHTIGMLPPQLVYS